VIGGAVGLFLFYGALTGIWFAVVGWFLLGAAEAERDTASRAERWPACASAI